MAVVFAFRTHIPNPVKLLPIHLRSLEPDALYEIVGYGIRSTKAWATIGLEFPTGPMAFGFENIVSPEDWRLGSYDFSSAVLRIHRLEKP